MMQDPNSTAVNLSGSAWIDPRTSGQIQLTGHAYRYTHTQTGKTQQGYDAFYSSDITT